MFSHTHTHLGAWTHLKDWPLRVINAAFLGLEKPRTFAWPRINTEMVTDMTDWPLRSNFYAEMCREWLHMRVYVCARICVCVAWRYFAWPQDSRELCVKAVVSGGGPAEVNGSTLLSAQQAVTLSHGVWAVRLNTLLQACSSHSRRNNTKNTEALQRHRSWECLTDQHMLTMPRLNLMTHFLLATKWIGISLVIRVWRKVNGMAMG